MTLKESFDKCNSWHQRCIIIETYHLLKTFNNRDWKVRDTANYFGISMGQCSENLNLAFALKQDESLKELSRNKALKRLRANE